jgi:hypothetical protein
MSLQDKLEEIKKLSDHYQNAESVGDDTPHELSSEVPKLLRVIEMLIEQRDALISEVCGDSYLTKDDAPKEKENHNAKLEKLLGDE